ncbi:MAG: hypothetical protein IKN38_05495 [Clostridia bacterium]|nr:hypothetical protein [Clostridia bacterium]
MKIKIIRVTVSLLLAVLFAFTAVSCEKKSDDKSTADGGVTDSAQTVETSVADTEQGVDGSEEELDEIVFDENGNIVGRNFFNENGERTISETFDELGRMTSYITFRPDGRITENSVYEYGSDAEMPAKTTSEIFNYDDDGIYRGSTVTVLNALGLVTDEVTYDANGELTGRRLYEYDSMGRGLITKSSTVNENNIVVSVSEYEYDDDGNVLKASYKNGSGEPVSSVEYEYDDAGNLIKESVFENGGELTSYTEYEYDDSGNLVNQRDYFLNENGEFELFE